MLTEKDVERERELYGLIDNARRRYQEEVQPWIDELTQIGMCKPPAPILLPDGRTMTYIGPVPHMEDGRARL